MPGLYGRMKKQAEAVIPTPQGKFRMIAYAAAPDDPMPHVAMVHESFVPGSEHPTTVRIHSECMTGDLFGSHRCDCGEQLDAALRAAARTGGVVVYLRQEGRGIGLINKLRAYELQDEGHNTLTANTHLGLPPDARTYEDAVTILSDLDISRIRLLTNNPLKIDAIDRSAIEVVDRVALEIPLRSQNRDYLLTKQKKMGHLTDYR